MISMRSTLIKNIETERSKGRANSVIIDKLNTNVPLVESIDHRRLRYKWSANKIINQDTVKQRVSVLSKGTNLPVIFSKWNSRKPLSWNAHPSSAIDDAVYNGEAKERESIRVYRRPK